MTRNIRTLGILLAALCGMSAMAASGASAHTFQSPNATTIITAEQEVGVKNFWGVKGAAAEVTCTTGTFGGTATGTSVASMTVHPTYSGCTAGILGNSPVDTSGCDFILTTNTTTHNKTDSGTETDAAITLECTAGNSIVTTVSGCPITIGAQAGLHGVTYKNEGGNVTINVTIDNMHYATPGGFVCSLGGLSTTGNNMFMTGAIIAKGFTDSEASGPAAHQHVFTKEGAQLAIKVE